MTEKIECAPGDIECDRRTRWWRIFLEIPVILWEIVTEPIKLVGVVFGGWIIWNALQETGAEFLDLLHQLESLYQKLFSDAWVWNAEQTTLVAAFAFGVGLALYKSYLVWGRIRTWAREHFGGGRKPHHLTTIPS